MYYTKSFINNLSLLIICLITFMYINMSLKKNRLEWLVVGDIGIYNTDFYRLISNQKNDSNKFLIVLGDNFYPHGIDKETFVQWNNVKKMNDILNIPIYPILGNHDYHLDPIEQVKFNKYNWNMPHYYYYKEYPKFNLGLWYIDTQILTLSGPELNKDFIENKVGKLVHTEHIQWLDETLNKSRMKIKIVNGHYPMFSNGNYRENVELIKILYPLFKKYNVKIYFSGHDHTFQHLTRTYLNHNIHQIIIGCSSEVRNHNIKRNLNKDILFNKKCIIKCSLTNNYLNIRVFNINNDILYYLKIKV